MKINFKIRASFNKYFKIFLGTLPFILTIALYLHTSYQRRQENPDDKAMPRIEEMLESIKKFTFSVDTDNQFDADGNMSPYTGPKNFSEAFKKDGMKGVLSFYKKGNSQLWQDLYSTMYRFLLSLAIIYLTVFIGLFMGSFSIMEDILYKYVLFLDKIPAIVLTPILFIFVTSGNPAIISLIVLAVAPTVILDTYLKVKEVPNEQIIKGMTLNASVLESIFRITYAQIIPKVYDTIRLNFKSIINMLLIGELLGAETGLGYRIFMVKRYTDMATIIPYVLILGIIIFILDQKVRNYNTKKYRWLNK